MTGSSTSGSERCTPLFECLECGDQHTREEREAHPFRPDISICPECKAKRAKVVRDYEGPVGDSEIRTDGGTETSGSYREPVTLKWWSASGLQEREVDLDEIESVTLGVRGGSHNPFAVRLGGEAFPLNCCSVEYPAWEVFGQPRDNEEFCHRCNRNFLESNLTPITTIANGVEEKEWVCPGCEPDAREDEKPVATDGGSAVSEQGKYGDTRILVDELDNSFQQVDDDLKAKVWESDEGDRRLYLRVRDREDGRKFNEYSVDLGRYRDTGSSHDDELRTDGGDDEETFVDPFGFEIIVDDGDAVLQPRQPVDQAVQLEGFEVTIEPLLLLAGEYPEGTYADVDVEIERDSTIGPTVVVTPAHAEFPVIRLKPRLREERDSDV